MEELSVLSQKDEVVLWDRGLGQYVQMGRVRSNTCMEVKGKGYLMSWDLSDMIFCL